MIAKMDYYGVVVPEGDNPTDGQVRLGLQSDGSPAIVAGGVGDVPNGYVFTLPLEPLAQETCYEWIVVVDDALCTLRGDTSFCTAPFGFNSSIARGFVEQYDDPDGRPIVVGWVEDPRR